MDLAACFLDEDGIMILTVPIGQDAVAWNAGRRYGEARLPRLLKGWENISVIGYSIYICTHSQEQAQRERERDFVAVIVLEAG